MLLRLHKGYTIPSTVGITTKLAQQFVGPFRVIEKIGRLAYKLKISPNWNIHPVFTIAQLEPYVSGDSYERELPEEPPELSTERELEEELFVVDCLLNGRVVKKEKD